MEIKENTLVIVLEDNGTPPRMCWGLVKHKLPTKNYMVRIERLPFRRDHRGKQIFFPEEIVVLPRQIIPIIQTDGSAEDPFSVIKENIGEIFLRIFLDSLLKKDPRINPVPIEENTLVIVINPVTCWGIVEKHLPGGKVEINIGKRERKILRPKSFFPERITVSREQIIPVLKVGGGFRTPKKAIFRNLSRLLMEIVLQHYVEEGGRALQKILAARASNLGVGT